MRLSLMSWVCPSLSMDELVQYGATSPYDGIELRVDQNHAHGVSRRSSAADRERVCDLVASHGLSLPCIATSHRLAGPEHDGAVLPAAKADVELAADLGARYIRVFAGGPGSSLDPETTKSIADSLSALGTYARGFGVSPLVEVKHDVLTTADAAVEILERVETANVGILWNDSTISNAVVARLGDRINHVHVHESVLDPQNGDVERLATELQTVGYDGFISLKIIRGENVPRDGLTEAGLRLRRQLNHAAR